METLYSPFRCKNGTLSVLFLRSLSPLSERVPSSPFRNDHYLDVCVNLYLCKTILKATESWQNSLWTTKPILAPITLARFHSLPALPPSPILKQFSKLKVVLLQCGFQLELTERLGSMSLTTFGHTDQFPIYLPWLLKHQNMYFSHVPRGADGIWEHNYAFKKRAQESTNISIPPIWFHLAFSIPSLACTFLSMCLCEPTSLRIKYTEKIKERNSYSISYAHKD